MHNYPRVFLISAIPELLRTFSPRITSAIPIIALLLFPNSIKLAVCLISPGLHQPHILARMIENTTRIRVRYADTDQMGFAYYANYLVWFEVGRTEMLRASGLPYAELEKAGVALPVLEAHCKYRKSARYDQMLRVVSRLKEMPRASLRIDYEIFDEADQLLAEGYTTHTFINGEGRPVRPPQIFTAKMREVFK